ncbi:MAG: methyltransferase domain-containing protein [Gammaproteobacteria bacterium]|nr:methyltransferase domain-containing protein [Gammaproteobacteria bacterium]
MLICPHCQTALQPIDQCGYRCKAYRCENNHSFDVGKAGDVNLLLPNQKRSKNPGDSKAMVGARRDFLASDVYQPIAELLAKYITMLGQGEAQIIADAGCGEGYYLRQVQRLCYPNLDCSNSNYFTDNGGAFIGWDISKYAVQSAAKQSTFSAKWLTASNAAIPIADNQIDILLSNFGFEVADEFARVVKSGGYVMTLDVGEKHLLELRKLIYPSIKPYHAKLPLSVLTLLKEDSLQYEITLSAQQIAQLMLMTPHFYRATQQAKEKLSQRTKLSVTVSVLLRIYRV